MAGMQTNLRWIWLVTGLVVAHGLHAQPRTPIEQVKPNALELTQLPRYCWGSMAGAAYTQPEYNIRDCGPRMNHFCPALLAMLRASDVSRSREQRRFLANYGAREVQYTLADIPAACPVLPDVKRAESRAALLVSLLK
jgi:hypothetical protein